ncbi:protease [Bradyrhizobium sp. AC87j1]|uniref:S8 family peptidase n=1 Tax=Bradyrhizobium sp. AC87j1 TaxID=2055894 RepID=UPI000CEBDC27|nr:S8 family serine peptidase [Bradyrhizobium sp. AC87j1]PPQ17849.1 protease [Bradyrhizobium sp. AC87j1]
MAKRSTRRISSERAEGTPRLGSVVRFTPQATRTGVKQLEGSGFRVASSKDFRSADAVPNDFDGADVQYFERFGIAIVRRDGERLRPMVERAMQQKIVSAVRPERTYRALGGAGMQRAEAPQASFAGVATLDQDYLRGYRDGISELVDRLLGNEVAEGERAAVARVDETAATWGLQAARVIGSGLTGAGIRVAVLDTGFDHTHQDFVGRAVTKKLFASRSSEDDVHGHGTHCIGTACGPMRPTSGPRYGIAYEAEIYAGKVLGDDGFGTDRSIIAGMDWALDQGCQVISMSLGAATRLGDQPSDDYEQIGQVCLDAGTLVIAAAGNESLRPQRIAPVGSPANASTIMAVAAVDSTLRIASFSCGGMNPDQEVDIAAPGVAILSSIPGNNYDRWDGTSMATPHVTGVAALIAQSNNAFRGWALWARLLQISKRLRFPPRDIGKGFVQAPPS